MKTSIYLPDELAEQVRAYGISISEVAQKALRKAVHAASIERTIMTDINSVAERLRGTIDDHERDEREEGRADGIRWAREYATADELEYMASYDGRGGDFSEGSLLEFMSDNEHLAIVSVRIDIEEAYWQGFIEGAGKVWEAVNPLL